MYPKLSGMTGTAMTEAGELKDIYNLDVVSVPTHNKITRIDYDDIMYGTKAEKYAALIDLIKDCYERGQPVLVGTISIEKSEEISKELTRNKIQHNVLNAKMHEHEAYVIAQAGRFKAVTIATNMAGRGTDIMLGGNPEMIIENLSESLTETQRQLEIQRIKQEVKVEKEKVLATGGLYVIGTERHESRRIDNQLRGRSGRQGDPGKSKFFLSLEDDLMRIFGSEKLQSLLSTFGLKDDEAIFHPWITKTLAGAQKKVENRNYEIRKNLLKYDDIVNHQRKNIFNLRFEIISSDDVSIKINEYISAINQDLVADCIPKNSYQMQWQIDILTKEIFRIYGLKIDLETESTKDGVGEKEILKLINDEVEKHFRNKEQECDPKIIKQIQKQIFLITIDHEWKDHLLSLDKLRHGINLRAYAQKDPLIEYKKDAFNLFEEMMMRIEEQVVSRLAHVQITANQEDVAETKSISSILPSKNKQQKNILTRVDPAYVKSEAKPIKELSGFSNKKIPPNLRNKNDPNSWGEVSRNEQCPCGSGKKYKNCHGS
jgi:preprotein translocase subunit SecA